MRRTAFVSPCMCALAWLPAAACAQIQLASPDRTIAVTIAADAQGAPRVAVSRHGETVLAPSPLGFNVTGGTGTGALAMHEVGRERIGRSVPPIASKAASARDRDRPLETVSDSPDIHEDVPRSDFIRTVSMTRDETRFLDGDIGSHVVVARRKGRDGSVGAMTNVQGRTVTLPLSFLGRGRYAATIWQDGAAPTEAVRTDRVVDARDAITLGLALSGGGVVHLAALR